MDLETLSFQLAGFKPAGDQTLNLADEQPVAFELAKSKEMSLDIFEVPSVAAGATRIDATPVFQKELLQEKMFRKNEN